MQLKYDLISQQSFAQKQKSSGETGKSLKQEMTKIRKIISEQK
jgi:hypothetical protein